MPIDWLTDNYLFVILMSTKKEFDANLTLHNSILDG